MQLKTGGLLCIIGMIILRNRGDFARLGSVIIYICCYSLGRIYRYCAEMERVKYEQEKIRIWPDAAAAFGCR